MKEGDIIVLSRDPNRKEGWGLIVRMYNTDGGFADIYWHNLYTNEVEYIMDYTSQYKVFSKAPHKLSQENFE